ncbi:hypothetical protein [Alicyclobacillus fodiniaquatilis]|uniref:Glycosyl transferase family 2 n=1 Tax=Alicyclobacillus fodiniaquatilis TaxID=1661150 RepID=A0ABW4JBI5_9BACL
MTEAIYAIVGARNEEKTIANVLHQLERLHVSGATLVLNGCTDGTQAICSRLQRQLSYPLALVVSDEALGHDVARAVGTYHALRKYRREMAFVYVDADWGGSFAPMLEAFVHDGLTTRADVTSVSFACLEQGKFFETMSRPWKKALACQQTIPLAAAPFMLPMLVQARLFARLSPLALSHPGHWIAQCATLPCRWRIYDHWDLSLVGHLAKSERHNHHIAARIAADGEIAYRLLNGLPLLAQRPISALPPRNFAWLRQYAATISWPETD